jgi:hypothetical protein
MLDERSRRVWLEEVREEERERKRRYRESDPDGTREKDTSYRREYRQRWRDAGDPDWNRR